MAFCAMMWLVCMMSYWSRWRTRHSQVSASVLIGDISRLFSDCLFAGWCFGGDELMFGSKLKWESSTRMPFQDSVLRTSLLLKSLSIMIYHRRGVPTLIFGVHQLQLSKLLRWCRDVQVVGFTSEYPFPISLLIISNEPHLLRATWLYCARQP